jgi:acyl carrier protein
MATNEELFSRDDFDLLQPFVEPKTPTESALARIWRDAIGIDRIGLDDSFFDLSGKSFTAAVIFARIEERFGLKLPMTLLVEAGTIGLLAHRIETIGRRLEAGATRSIAQYR